MTRIAHVLAARGGGVQRVVVRLASALGRHGLDTTVVMPRWQGPFLDELPDTVQRVSLDTRHPLLVVGRLARLLRRVPFDCILVNQPQMIVALIAAQRLARTEGRVVAVLHNDLQVLLRERRLLPRLLPSVLGISLRACDMVVCVSHGLKQSIADRFRLPSGRIEVIHNPASTGEVRASSDTPCPHPWLEGPNRAPVVIGAGNFNAQKDFTTLIEAFARLRTHQAARLILLGDGPQAPELRRLVAERGLSTDVSFAGWVDDPPAYMARADVFVLSSRWEGFALVLVEALSAGCPVVSTDCPSGPREILDQGRFGHLVPVGDARRLADAVSATIRQPPDPTALRGRAQAFSVDRAVAGYLRLLELGPTAIGSPEPAPR